MRLNHKADSISNDHQSRILKKQDKNKNTCHFPDHSKLLNLMMEGLNGSIDRLCIARLKAPVEHISAGKGENNFLPTWVGK